MSSSSDNNNQLSDKQEADFEKMLPWLINGTLAEPERKELENALTKSEKLRNEKAFLSQLQQQVKQQAMPDVPVEFAWQRMKKQIADENKLATNSIRKDSGNRDNKWRFIAMAASVLLVIQSGSMLVSWNQEDIYKPLSGNANDHTSAKVNAAQFTVQFVDTATALEIQQLLRELQLSLISGPSSVGLYRVSGPTDSIKNGEKILNQIKSRSNVIAHVQQDE